MISEVKRRFQKSDFKKDPLPKGEYEQCNFNGCDLSECDLAGIKFIDCEFVNCNFSNAKLFKTVIRDCRFTDNKMLGLRFDQCNEYLSFSFKNCNLSHAVFSRIKATGSKFENCKLLDCDFTGADVSGGSFFASDLQNAIFEDCNLEKTDFRETQQLVLDPEKNRLKKARFSPDGLQGLLGKYQLVVS